MKLRTRLATAFLTITIAPLVLIFIAVYGLSDYQARSFRKAYGLSEQIELLSGNSMQIFNQLTKESQQKIPEKLQTHPDKFEDVTFLEQVNELLLKNYAF